MFSLGNLDEDLQEYLNFTNGFFIECGANDGITQSNTAYLEKYKNWNGLLIEPGYLNYLQCVKNRPNSIVENLALVDKDYSKNTIAGNFNNHHFNGLMNSVDDTPDYFDDEMINNLKDFKGKFKTQSVEVKCCTLQFLIEKHNIKNIDFFSLDTEGYELAILKGLNFSKNRPRYILIETTVNKKYTNKINEFMDSVGYLHIKRLSINDSLYMDKQ